TLTHQREHVPRWNRLQTKDRVGHRMPITAGDQIHEVAEVPLVHDHASARCLLARAEPSKRQDGLREARRHRSADAYGDASTAERTKAPSYCVRDLLLDDQLHGLDGARRP